MGQIIETKMQRFSPAKKRSPSPTEYNTLKSFDYVTKSRGMMGIGKEKRESPVDKEIKRSISPGPAKHTTDIKVLNMLSHSNSHKRL